MIWLNGEILEIDVVELFTYIRNLPEIVADEFVTFNSRPARLMAANSDWGSVVAEHIWILIIEMSRNGMSIIQDYPDKNASRKNGKILKQQIGNLEILAEKLRSQKIAIWDTDIENLTTTIQRWEDLKRCDCILMLPHLQKELSSYAEGERMFRKLARKEIANLNGNIKHLR